MALPALVAVLAVACGADSSPDSSGPTEKAGTVVETPDKAAEPQVDFGRFRQLLARDAIQPIYEPSFVAGKLASLDPRALVIGVEIDGESKAYPVGPLNLREMVNDQIGGVPILVTW